MTQQPLWQQNQVRLKPPCMSGRWLPRSCAAGPCCGYSCYSKMMKKINFSWINKPVSFEICYGQRPPSNGHPSCCECMTQPYMQASNITLQDSFSRVQANTISPIIDDGTVDTITCLAFFTGSSLSWKRTPYSQGHHFKNSTICCTVVWSFSAIQ